MQAQRKGFRQGFSMFPWLRLFIIALTSAAYWIVLRWALQSRARRVATDGRTCSKEAMMKWATSHGVQAHKMAIGEFAYEDHLAEGDYWLDSIRLRRGLLAVESISEGEVLVSLPWRSCITTEHLRASQHPLAGMVANEQDKTLEQHEMLALFLLYEYHQPNSAWAPYSCMLPRKLTSPIFWPTSMLGMIPSGPLLEQTLALKKTLAQRFEETVAPAVGRYKSVFPADVLTLPNFLWAIGTVKARNWGMSWKGKTLSFLAPLADLVNHHSLKGGGAHLSYLSTPAPPGYVVVLEYLNIWF
jgi:hypothetical protein